MSLISIQDKFLAAPSSLPWSTLVGATFGSPIMYDIDGDGRAECVCVIPDPHGITNPSWGVLSFFQFSQICSTWTVEYDVQLISTTFVQSPLIADNPIVPLFQIQGSFTDANKFVVLFYDIYTNLRLFEFSTSTVDIIYSEDGSIPGAGTGGNWNLSSGQVLFAADVDGDGLDEVVIYDNTQTIGVLKWSAPSQGFVTLCMQTSASNSSGVQTFSFSKDMKIQVGDINNDGSEEIIVIDNNQNFAIVGLEQGSLSLLQLEEQMIPSSNTNAQAWSISGTTQLLINDINNDGLNEIIVVGQYYNLIFAVGQMAVLAWSDEGVAVSSSVEGNVVNWAIPGDQVVSAGPFQEAGVNALLSYSPSLASFAILSINSPTNDFSVQYVNQGTIPATAAAGPYPIISDTTFAVADVDGDGLLEILVQSNSAAVMAALKWANSALATIWLASMNPADDALLGCWGMGTMYQAPATSFASWPNNDQSEIYNKLSSSVRPAIDDEIRAEYTNANNVSSSFSQWMTQINDNLPSAAESNSNISSGGSFWNWTSGYGTDDLLYVFNQIYAELTAVSDLYAFQSSLSDYLDSIQAGRTADLGAVVENLAATPASSQQVSYWPDQIMMAAMWGLAALAGGVEGGLVAAIGFSVAASMFGSVLGETQTSNPSPPPINVAYDVLISQFASDTSTAKSAVATQISSFFTDPVKLLMLSWLLETAWPNNALSAQTDVSNLSPYNRFNFYQVLLGTQFQWSHWSMTTQVAPWTLVLGEEGQPTVSELTVPTGSFANLNGDVFLLQALGSDVYNPSLPSQGLIGDLFTTLNINIADMIYGNYGWSIPQYLYAIGDDTGGPDFGNLHIYITNLADEPLWYTLYVNESSIQSSQAESGSVNPGQTLQSQNQYSFRSDYESKNYTYKILGQYNGETGSENETSMQMLEPTVIIPGSTISVNTWYSFDKTTGNPWWTCANPS